MPIRSDGKIKIHGPVLNRCLGSGVSPVDPPFIAVTHMVESSTPSSSPSVSADTPGVVNDTSPLPLLINPGRFTGKVVKRIPRASRHQAALKLTDILDDLNASNSSESWERLFLFPRRCLQAPKKGGHRRSRNLATEINQALVNEMDPGHTPPTRVRGTNAGNLAARVSSKLEDGDFRGAVRIASSQDTFCVPDDRSLNLLKEKHPAPHPDGSLPEFQSPDTPLVVSSFEVTRAVYSFPSGSAGCHDGLLPQHLKDLISPTLGLDSSSLITSLTTFINKVVSGNGPISARPFFFGADLIGLNKPDGGIRPIAIGSTLRRLAAKCVSAAVKEEMGSLLFPTQLGFGTPMGAEATVHAARSYLNGMIEGNSLVKLDFQNAFNSIRRDSMLKSVLEKVPLVFPLAFTSYCQPTFLFFGNYIIHSCEGVQQGDPLGPLLFCLAIQDLITSLKSEFNVFYLDDGTLGESLEDIKSDLAHLKELALNFGLKLNCSKSELICVEDATRDSILSHFPSLRDTPPERATLLGSPIGGIEAIEIILQQKMTNLEKLGERLKVLQAHDALCLLRNAFSLPKLLYTLRTAPCYQSILLSSFDCLQRSLLESICNIHLTDSAWLQASLPATFGGLGVRSAVMLAPSAFLASAAGCASLSQVILPERLHNQDSNVCTEAMLAWSSASPVAVVSPTGSDATRQKFWDLPIIEGHFESLLATADSRGRARLLASKQKESGAWLTSPPVSALGLRMGNETIRTAVGLRLGASLCVPHYCPAVECMWTTLEYMGSVAGVVKVDCPDTQH